MLLLVCFFSRFKNSRRSSRSKLVLHGGWSLVNQCIILVKGMFNAYLFADPVEGRIGSPCREAPSRRPLAVFLEVRMPRRRWDTVSAAAQDFVANKVPLSIICTCPQTSPGALWPELLTNVNPKTLHQISFYFVFRNVRNINFGQRAEFKSRQYVFFVSESLPVWEIVESDGRNVQ